MCTVSPLSAFLLRQGFNRTTLFDGSRAVVDSIVMRLLTSNRIQTCQTESRHLSFGAGLTLCPCGFHAIYD